MNNKKTKSNWHFNHFNSDAKGPLVGIRVLDLSRLVAGNMTTLQLADFGAEVIKVEPLPNGDPLRSWKQGGEASFWKVYARNKKSVGINFRSSDFKDIISKLIAVSDVMVESFKPGTLEKMGLGLDQLLKINPNLIVLRISGFGQTGPYSPRPGFGTLVESMSGFAHRNGEKGGGPLLPPLALADMISGLYGANAVLIALRARDKGSGGQEIDLSLLDSIVSVLGPEALDFKLTGKPKPRLGNQSNMSIPRNIYKTNDGHYLSISASIPQMAARLFVAIGKPYLNSDNRFNTNEARLNNRQIVDSTVAKWISARSRDEVMKVFSEAGVTVAPLYSISDIIHDQHFIERGVYVEIPDEDHGTIPVHKPVPTLSATPANFWSGAPKLGEHTRDILLSAGFEEIEITSLLDQGSIG